MTFATFIKFHAYGWISYDIIGCVFISFEFWKYV